MNSATNCVSQGGPMPVAATAASLTTKERSNAWLPHANT